MRKPVTGLQIPDIPPPEQESLHKKWDTINLVEGELAMKGFIPMDTPQYQCPQITEDLLTTANNEQYTQTYAQQLAWFNYSAQVLAGVTSHLLQYENEMEMIESKMRVAFRNGIRAGERDKMTKEEMQDEINLDVRYQELKHTAQMLKQKKTQLQAFVDGIERGLRVISRQVEIKKLEAEQNKTNIPGRQFGQQQPWRGGNYGQGDE
jgi:hypothetical protein